MSYAFDPELVPVLDLLPPTDISDPAAVRPSFEQMIGQLNAGLDETGIDWEDRDIPGSAEAPPIRLRIYRPTALQGITAGLLYLHGGGFVIGSLNTEHGSCLGLCRDLGIVIVSVDYRLAPETPYPGGLEDCYSALEWVAANNVELGIDPQRLGIFGQSAGGGLSAATALLARDRGGPGLCFQYLGIPELDDRLETASMRHFIDTPLWDRHKAELSWDHYLGKDYRRGADDVPCHAAPARAQDLVGLPPAHITTMEYDPLRDEGILYAMALMAAGVSTELHSFQGTFHGSSLVPTAAVSRREADEMRMALRRGLSINEDNSKQDAK